jgi:transposase InsO family protein
MKCSTCAAHQKPKVARPSTFKSELDFNDKIFIDGITWTNKTGKSFHFYHIIDQATNFHVAMPAPCRAAEQAVQCVLEGWFQWAGPPNTMVTDSATEFTSETFTNFLQRHDVKAITTAPHAHWQNGRCERHGHIIQSMLDKIDHDMPIQSYLDLHQALVQSTHAKNTLSIRKGYSPEVLVFGKSSRIPGSLTSCENEPSMASADRDDAQGISFRRNL